MTTFWPMEHSDALRKLCHAEVIPSANDMANELNAMLGTSYSRNAVIGRVNRMGLRLSAMKGWTRSRKKAEPRPKPIKARTVLRIVQNRAEPVSEYFEELRQADVAPRYVSLIELQADECRYPFGDGAKTTFCGCEAIQGLPYCEPHFRLTHRDEVLRGDDLAKWQRLYRRRAA